MASQNVSADTNQTTVKPDDNEFPLLQVLGLVFLTFNSGMALYRSRNDTGYVAFILVSYFDLVCLFVCLRQFEKTPKDDTKRRSILKVAIWSLSTILTTMFSHRVASIMPIPVAILIWTMAGMTLLGGFYAFFIYKEPNENIEKNGYVAVPSGAPSKCNKI